MELFAQTVGIVAMCANTKAISSPCWLIYNCINMSLGGILCEAVSLVSIISAYLRLDVPKQDNRLEQTTNIKEK